MSRLTRSLATLLAWNTLNTPFAEAQSVFCHYMVSTIDEGSDHAETDIREASSLGIDAFALNVGNPGADWTQSALSQLFDIASSTDLKLFFSLDLYQESDLSAYEDILSEYLGHPSYFTAGTDNLPVLSTYSVGGYGPETFQSWISDAWSDQIYFLPNADNSEGYEDPSSWFQTWGDVVDGVFGWETAWPAPGNTPENVSSDIDMSVQDAAHANGKTYMAPLSSVQYKKCCGGHYYRVGETNLPEKMSQILDFSPDFVEILTWNDAGESHYIGNGWPEGLTDEILAYADTEEWPHTDWQPVIASFITAYKSGGDASTMAPPSGSQAIGAMWYRTIPKDAPCGGDKPDNFGSAQDAVNYAVVVDPDNANGLTIRVTSGGEVIEEVEATPGLNYGSALGMNLGEQMVELVDGDSVSLTAVSSVDVVSDSDSCNFNYQVVGLQ